MEQLGAKLKAARKGSGRYITEISEEIGISVPTIYKMEKGDETVTVARYRAYAENLGMDMQAAITEVPEHPKSAQVSFIALGDYFMIGIAEEELKKFKEQLLHPDLFSDILGIHTVHTINGNTYTPVQDVINAWKVYKIKTTGKDEEE